MACCLITNMDPTIADIVIMSRVSSYLSSFTRVYLQVLITAFINIRIIRAVKHHFLMATRSQDFSIRPI